MPNGHSGIPQFGSVVLIAMVIALLIWWERSTAFILPRVLSLIGAGIFGWRLAFHLTMWNVTEYNGNYASGNQIKNARRRYLAARLVLVPLTVLGVYLLVAQK